MRGYWKRPDETAKVMLGDWLRTGDIGRIDEDGFVYIEDRKKDMILVSGFNVYPNEVESVVATHPGVLEVAAVAQPDERSGEVVALFVVKQGSGPHRAAGDRLLPRTAHRLQGAATRLLPQRAAEDERRQDSAPRALRDELPGSDRLTGRRSQLTCGTRTQLVHRSDHRARVLGRDRSGGCRGRD